MARADVGSYHQPGLDSISGTHMLEERTDSEKLCFGHLMCALASAHLASHTYIHTYRQTDRHTDRQTETHTHTHTHTQKNHNLKGSLSGGTLQRGTVLLLDIWANKSSVLNPGLLFSSCWPLRSLTPFCNCRLLPLPWLP